MSNTAEAPKTAAEIQHELSELKQRAGILERRRSELQVKIRNARRDAGEALAKDDKAKPANTSAMQDELERISIALEVIESDTKALSGQMERAELNDATDAFSAAMDAYHAAARDADEALRDFYNTTFAEKAKALQDSIAAVNRAEMDLKYQTAGRHGKHMPTTSRLDYKHEHGGVRWVLEPLQNFIGNQPINGTLVPNVRTRNSASDELARRMEGNSYGNNNDVVNESLGIAAGRNPARLPVVMARASNR